MPVFQDSENVSYELLKPGDYILTVFEFTTDLSSSAGATNGKDRFNIVFNVEGETTKVRETLYDAPTTIWKIDAFLKACGIRNLKKGQAFHFEKEKAEQMGIPWINPMGLRCEAEIVNETYRSTRSGKDVVKNKVETYYTDREVLKPDPELRQKLTNTAAQKEQGNKTPF